MENYSSDEPMYAYRIWRLWDDRGLGPTLTSATREGPRWPFRGLRAADFDIWKTKTMEAQCRVLGTLGGRHQAPERACKCGVYGYPDLLDALHLIDWEFINSGPYALGLVSGFGQVHNDGTIFGHDACIRFGEADIVAFARLGSGWRSGLLDQVAARLDVPVLSLNRMEKLAATGRPYGRDLLQAKAARYLDHIPVGERVTMAPSALLVDQNGRLFLRKDRETWQPNPLDKPNRLWVTPREDGRFTIQCHWTQPHQSEFVVLPFDGEAELSSGSERLAGRVSSIEVYSLDLVLRAPNNPADTVVVPLENRTLLTDLIPAGQRIPLALNSLHFEKSGEVWLGRKLFHQPLETTGERKFFLTKVDSCSFALEIEISRHGAFVAYTERPARHLTQDRDTMVVHLTVNGQPQVDGKIPKRWMKWEDRVWPPKSLTAGAL